MARARKLPAQHRRSQIIESAREVFAGQSYAKVGTADLAKAAGISEPALYRYFSGKKELFLATLRSTGPKLLEISLAAMMRATELSRPYCARIRRGAQIPHPRHWGSLRALLS